MGSGVRILGFPALLFKACMLSSKAMLVAAHSPVAGVVFGWLLPFPPSPPSPPPPIVLRLTWFAPKPTFGKPTPRQRREEPCRATM